MPLPPSLLQHVEQHVCFSGCYSSESDASVCLDPAKALQPLVVVSCHDCFAKIGVPLALLPAGTTTYSLADELSRHMRARRGFSLSFSGYHARGPGFWLTAGYYGSCGLFLLNGERSKALGNDLDLLILALKHKVAAAPDPRMIDPKLFATQTIYVRFAGPAGPFACKQDFLASPHCRMQAAIGYQRVTMAEFLPFSQPAQVNGPAVAAVSTSTAVTKTGKQPKIGEVCPTCGEMVRQRPLLQGTYVGCKC